MAKGDLETQQVPLMDPEQLKIYKALLNSFTGMMQGFPLGEAFGGPYESSYSPLIFNPNFSSQQPENANPGFFKNLITDIVNKEIPATKKGEEIPIHGPESFISSVINPVKPTNSAPATSSPDDLILQAILNPTTPSLPNIETEQKSIPDVTTAILKEIFTRPIISPYKEALTGNFSTKGGI